MRVDPEHAILNGGSVTGGLGKILVDEGSDSRKAAGKSRKGPKLRRIDLGQGHNRGGEDPKPLGEMRDSSWEMVRI